MSDRFNQQHYLIRKKFFHFFGASFHVFDKQNNVVMYSKQKAFKLKEDIRIYSSEEMHEEILTIKARSIFDFSTIYDVVDPKTQQPIGALKRKGLKSIFKDEWLFLDTQDQEIGMIQEDNVALAIIRRFLMNLIPQHFSGTMQGQPVCEFRQNFNPFILKVNVDFSVDQQNQLDKRLGLAAGVLLCAIEGRQE